MTLEQTRQLGIEFERRIQTMIPEREFLNKLDTETIYSFLNLYLDKYIHDIYRNLDNISSGTKLSAHIESILQSLLTSCEINLDENNNWLFGNGFPVEFSQDENHTITDENGIEIVDTARSLTFSLPESFYMYVRSVTKVSSTYSFKASPIATLKTNILPNQLVSLNDVWKLIETPHNSLRILRYPAIVLNVNNTASLIYDRYTTVKGIKILFYKLPSHFDLMTSTVCELPMDAFDDLVTGAVDLYVLYAAGAEANKRRQDEARKQLINQNKKDNEDED